MSNVSTIRSQRNLGMDALRGLAVLLMIEQHLGVWLWKGTQPGQSSWDYPFLLAFNALGGGAAPLFIALAGMGSSIFVYRRLAELKNPDAVILRRGLVLMAFGYFLSMWTPSWFTWRSWFVLHLMGFGMVLTPLFRRCSNVGLILVSASILLLTAPLQFLLRTPLGLTNHRMMGWITNSQGGEGLIAMDWAPLRLAFLEGQFPIFPWMVIFVFGMLTGRYLVSEREGQIARLAAVCAVLGIMGAIAGQVLATSPLGILGRSLRLPVPFFPMSPTLLLLLSALIFTAIYLVTRWDRVRPFSSRNVMVTLGRASLSLLLFHVVAFREWTRPFGWWQAFEPGIAFVILLAFILLCIVFCRWWQRYNYRYGAEWLLRKIAS